jgi:hypothetical protein
VSYAPARFACQAAGAMSHELAYLLLICSLMVGGTPLTALGISTLFLYAGLEVDTGLLRGARRPARDLSTRADRGGGDGVDACRQR